MSDFTEDIENIDPEQTAASRDVITSIMSEAYPDSKWGAGDQLEGLVSEPVALGHAYIREQMDKQDASFSLEVISNDPEAADDEMVDQLLSNYFIERQAATVSYGNVLTVVELATILSISNEAEFAVGTQTYVTTQSWRVYPPNTRDEDPENGILVMEERSDGTFQFLLPVQSVATGPETLVKRGTVMTPAILLPGQLQSTAAADFQGGLSADTNEDLVELANKGITPRVLSGHQHIERTLEKEYPGSLVRSVGAGNTVMTRDQDNLFGVSTGGKADIYVRSALYPVTETIRVSATLAPDDRASRTWRFSYVMPGVYEALLIREADSDDAGGITPATEQVRVSPPSSGFVPKMDDADAVFTAHQLRTVSFVDDNLDYNTLLEGVDANTTVTREYDVDILVMPSIEEIDLYVRDRDNRDPGLDALVRAACPVLVEARIIVRGIVDQSGAKAAIVDAISKLAADADVIPANLAYDAMRDYVDGTISTVYYSATILDQQLNRHFIVNRQELEIPNEPDVGLSVDSCAFMVEPDSISIEVI